MTGISVGDYRDPERGLELGELMCEVARVPGVQRVRLSSVEVIHVEQSLLRALTDEPKVCPHLHVPMQSGDDQVLRDMGRHYDSAEYLEHIARLRAAAPQVNLTTDVIVGFPTEDEAAFERTLDAVEAAAITRVHVFPYSPRPGTQCRRARRPGRAAGEKAPLADSADALRAPLAAAPQRQARTAPNGADRQARRQPVLGLHRRLHPLLSAGGRRRAREVVGATARSCTPTASVASERRGGSQ